MAATRVLTGEERNRALVANFRAAMRRLQEEARREDAVNEEGTATAVFYKRARAAWELLPEGIRERAWLVTAIRGWRV